MAQFTERDHELARLVKQGLERLLAEHVTNKPLDPGEVSHQEAVRSEFEIGAELVWEPKDIVSYAKGWVEGYRSLSSQVMAQMGPIASILGLEDGLLDLAIHGLRVLCEVQEREGAGLSSTERSAFDDILKGLNAGTKDAGTDDLPGQYL